MEAEKVRPGTEAGALTSHYHSLIVGLEKHLPAGEFETLSGNLKTKGFRVNSWTETQNLALVRIVKKVEDTVLLMESAHCAVTSTALRTRGTLKKSNVKPFPSTATLHAATKSS
jgi:hypothetical protein